MFQLRPDILRLLQISADFLIDLRHLLHSGRIRLPALFLQGVFCGVDVQIRVSRLLNIDQVIPQMFSQLTACGAPGLADEESVIEICLTQPPCKCIQHPLRVFRFGPVRLADHPQAFIRTVEIPLDPVDLFFKKKPQAPREIIRIFPWLPQLVLIEASRPVPGKAVKHGPYKSMKRTLSGLISAGDNIHAGMQFQPVVCKFSEMF